MHNVMGAEARRMPDAIAGSEGGENPQLMIPKSELIRNSPYPFQSVDESNLAGMSGSNFSRSLFKRHLPEVLNVAGVIKIVDGIHRTLAYPGEEVPVDNITADKFSGQTE